MPHGAPDWSNVVKLQQVHRLDDMAEAVVRLGSIRYWDRRGDTLFLDDFSYGLGFWEQYLSGVGSEIYLQTENWRSCGISCKLIGGSDALRCAEIYHIEPYPEVSTFGACFSFTYDANLETITLRFEIALAPGSHQFGVRWNFPNERLEYLDPGLAWKPFLLDVKLMRRDKVFHFLKLVVNAETGTYERVILDNYTAVLKDIKPYSEPFALEPFLNFRIIVTSQEGYNATCYIDNCILTTNEPVG